MQRVSKLRKAFDIKQSHISCCHWDWPLMSCSQLVFFICDAILWDLVAQVMYTFLKELALRQLQSESLAARLTEDFSPTGWYVPPPSWSREASRQDRPGLHRKFLLEHLLHQPLGRGRGVFQPKGHPVELEKTKWSTECSLPFVLFCYLGLVVGRLKIHGAEDPCPFQGDHGLFNVWYWVSISDHKPVQEPVFNTHSEDSCLFPDQHHRDGVLAAALPGRQ